MRLDDKLAALDNHAARRIDVREWEHLRILARAEGDARLVEECDYRIAKLTTRPGSTRCTITVLRSSRHGGSAVVDLDGLRSGYTVALRRDRGVTISELTYSGTLRLGPIGDWLSDMVPHLIGTGCGVTAYDLEVRDGECVARSVATTAIKAVA